jgi:putative transcriptional regulator
MLIGAVLARPDVRSRLVRQPSLAAAIGTVLALVVHLALLPLASAAGPGVVLVARPDLPDPNFARTVVVVAPNERGAGLGVILNRPAVESLASMMAGDARFARFTEPLFRGGPVEPLGLFAVFRAESAPAPALRISDDLWLALAPATVERLIAEPPAQIRFYLGYAGWAPGQIAAEIERGGWWVIDAEADVLFRSDTRGLWNELAKRAGALRTHYAPEDATAMSTADRAPSMPLAAAVP